MKPPAFSLSLLWIASQFVHAHRRADWLAEWTGELWAVAAVRPAAVWRFVLGSYADALTIFRWSDSTLCTSLESPQSCLALLVLLAVLAATLCPRIFKASARVMYPRPNAAFCALIAVAVLLLACVWSWQLAIPDSARLTRQVRMRWYLFLAAKFSLILIIAHQITIHLVQHGLPPQLVIVGCVAAFLWAQHEQRRRCPVCLHRLARPVRVGTYAQIFLGWNGTESVCLQGHGTLYLDFETAGHACRAEWIGMDSTWAELFLASNASG